MAEETDIKKLNFRSPVTLTLTMDLVIRHTVVHRSSTSIYIPNFIEIGKKLFLDGRTDGCTDVPTDGRTFPHLMTLCLKMLLLMG